MPESAHRIRRLTWLDRATSSAEAMARRQTLRAQLDSVLLPALERAFDRCDDDGRIVRISRLTVHVAADIASPEELARQIEERFVSELTDAIRRSTLTAIDEDSGGTRRAIRANLIDITEHRRDLLLSYLRTGRLAWSADEGDTNGTMAWLRDAAIRLATDIAELKAQLSGTLTARITFLFRLWQLLDAATRETLSSTMASDHFASPGGRSSVIPSHGTSNFDEVAWIAVAWAWQSMGHPTMTLDRLAEALRTSSDEPAIGAVLRAVSQRLVASGIEPLSHLSIDEIVPPASSERRDVGETSDSSAMQAAFDLISNQHERAATALDATSPQIPTEQPPDRREDDHRSRLAVPAWPPDRDTPKIHFPSRTSHVAQQAIESSGLLARDAGLILLHPYLPRLFDALGIVRENPRRIASESLPRAAALLHWLARGPAEIYEFELSLSKVLLGLSPGDPLPVADGLLDDADRAEGDSLLTAVVQHWSALRGTSIAGLRTSFLWRTGLLTSDADGWRLRMELAPFDVLLGQLPWGLAVVRLPWMTKPIFTEWPAP